MNDNLSFLFFKREFYVHLFDQNYYKYFFILYYFWIAPSISFLNTHDFALYRLIYLQVSLLQNSYLLDNISWLSRLIETLFFLVFLLDNKAYECQNGSHIF